MSNWLVLSLLATALSGARGTTAADANSPDLSQYQVVRVSHVDAERSGLLGSLSFFRDDVQLWSDELEGADLELRASSLGLETLAALGLAYHVVIPDLQSWYDERFAGNATRGFFDSLRTYSEHVTFMQQLAAAHPQVAEVIEVGTSVQGRVIYGLRIGGGDPSKPGVLFHGAQHGNEAAGASVLAYVADHLLGGYGVDPDLTALVDEVEWFLVPIVNVDRYPIARYNAHGVDLNRNWGGPGSGQDPSGGPYPFSEPETAALRDLMLNYPQIRLHVDYHGYVNWFMWTWGHKDERCKDHGTYRRVGLHVREMLLDAGAREYCVNRVYHCAYPVSGGSIDYSVGDLGIWGYAIEVYNDHMPDICEQFLGTNLYLGQRMWDCNGNAVPDADDIASGTSADANANLVPDECECFADVNFDGTVDLLDLSILLASFGIAGDMHVNQGDLDDDDDVDLDDLSLFLTQFGRVCTY